MQNITWFIENSVKNQLLRDVFFVSDVKISNDLHCSVDAKNYVEMICWLKEIERVFIQNERKLFLKKLSHFRFLWAIKSIYLILTHFFAKKKRYRRIINVWQNIDYNWNIADENYLRHAIKTVSLPEQKSKITYLLSKNKDKRMINKFKKKWKIPTQLDLFLQQCRKWQIILTNGLDVDGNSSFFKEITQAVSGSRWCHSMIISDVIRWKDWLVSDLKIIQSTLNWWVHETWFRQYISENYSKSDFLVASLPKRRRLPIILNAKAHMGEKYDRMAMILDIISWWDAKFVWDSSFVSKTYCSALVFDEVKKAYCHVPYYHITPSDILLIDWITPEYACYCDHI